ncbi:hypothetical protein, partial [Bartonella sp. AU55XJBT]|uniref:hypothetical protein n=1 Tax=Bartonella sp. AU55XJBT TaxID=3019091 RepID=UPI00236174C5
MKKLYAPQATSELKRSRFSFVKILSLATVATFLSSVAPVFSANSDFRNVFLEGVNSAGISYPQSIVSVAGLNASSVSKEDYLTVLNKAGAEKVKTSSDYANFLTRTLSGKNDESSIINVLVEDSDSAQRYVQDILKVGNAALLKAPKTFVKGDFNREEESSDVFAPAFDYTITKRLIPINEMLRETRANQGVMLGENAKATEYSSIAIGREDPECKNIEGKLGCTAARALAERAIAIGLASVAQNFQGIAIGAVANASADNAVVLGAFASGQGKGSTALGHSSKALAEDSIALGHIATASGKQGIAIGLLTKVSGDQGIAIGNGANASKEKGVALGASASANGDRSIALGDYAKVSGDMSVALGADATASKKDSIAIGHRAQALGVNSIAIGNYNAGESITKAEGSFATVVGDFATAGKDYATAFGAGSDALGTYSVSMGYKAKAGADSSVAMGVYASASGGSGIAIGSYANVTVEGGVAIGNDSVSDRAAGVFGYTSLLQGPATNTESQWKSTRGAVSVGNLDKNITRQITGVAAGSKPADAVNLRQLQDLEEVVRKHGWKLSVGGENGKTVLMDSDVDFSTGSENFKITKGDKDNKVQFDLAKDVTLTSLKAGTNTLDATGLVIENGPKITTGGIDAGSKTITGIKEGSLSAESTEAVTGSQLFAANNEIADVRDSILVKQVAEMTLARSLRDGGAGLITIGRGTGGNEISILNKDNGARKLSGLLGGTISESSDEAVSGGQIHTLGSSVASYFGGGASYESGAWTAPKFTVKSVKDDGETENKEYPDVASALSEVGTSITNVQNKLTEQVNNVINKVESESFVQQDKTTHRLTIGAAVEGSEINISNKDKEDRILSGVGEATKNNEAVNKGQLDKGLKDLSDNLQSDESAVVHYDKKAGETGGINYTSVTFGGKDKTAVGLHNIADGKISEDSHDAITGGQINKIGEDVAKFLGGEASFENGALTQPTYKLSYIAKDGVVTESSFQGVGTAFSGLDTNIKNVNDRIKEVSEGVAKDSLNWSSTEGAFVAQHGTGDTKANSKITFLAEGSIAAGSSDAVTGGQINTIVSGVTSALGGNASFSVDGTFTGPTYGLSKVSKTGDVTKESYEGVEKAFKGIDENIKTVNARIKDVSEGVAQDSLLWSSTEGAFVAQHGEKDSKANSKITSLANGDITQASTDAINGGQLYSMNETLAKYFGGETKYEEGKWTAPTFTLKSYNADGTEGDLQQHHNVTEAFAGIDKNLTNVVKNFNEKVNNIKESVQGDALLWSDSDKAFVAQHGSGDTKVNSKIKYLANGTIAANSTDAVNGSQLFETNKAVA